MNTRIPEQMHGLMLRLVEIYDAPDIVHLRSDPSLTQFMQTLENNVEKQEEWIREYKEREALGKDLYIAFSDQEGLVGYARLSHIDGIKKSCVASSWIKKPGAKGAGFRMFLARLDLAFEFLHLSDVYTSIHKENTKALNHWDLFLVEKKIKENGYCDIRVTVESFFENRSSYIEKFF